MSHRQNQPRINDPRGRLADPRCAAAARLRNAEKQGTISCVQWFRSIVGHPGEPDLEEKTEIGYFGNRGAK